MATQQKKKTTSSAKKTSGTAKKSANSKKTAQKPPIRREVGAVICLLLGVFSLIGFWGGSGVFIGFWSGLVKGLIGRGFFVFAPMLIVCAAILCFHRGRPVRARVVCALLLSVVFGALMHLFSCKITYEVSLKMFSQLWSDGRLLDSGGVISGALAVLFRYLFGSVGTAIVFIAVALLLVLITFNRTIVGIYDKLRNHQKREYEYVPAPEPEPKPAPKKKQSAHTVPPPAEEPKPARQRRKVIDIPMDDEPVTQEEAVTFPDVSEPLFDSMPRVPTPDQVLMQPDTAEEEDAPAEAAAEEEDIPLDIPFMDTEIQPLERKRTTQAESVTPEPPKNEPVKAAEPPAPVKTVADNGEIRVQAERPKYEFPPLSLLESGNGTGKVDGTEEVRLNSERLESAFRSFGVNVKIASATRGPSVTRYEAELEAGVKLSRLTSLADDIALSLGASGVRIAAMPNKISTVGIEVPNKLVSRVLLSDIIASSQFRGAPSKLTFAIGMNISGDSVVGNISKLPHMLVAGTTGSGKSVCLNSLILSILYKATPDEVKFIMIDPKMVEFRVYNGIPHLLVPVVTDVKKASGALQWAVVEMMKRYRLFSEVNARDLPGYNQTMKQNGEEPIPQMVIVIDELADLMMQAAKEVEESICRIAQMGRAAGVHLIIATQSPRADVITGLMKANIPSRIALKVSSSLESRIILDAGGNADKLVGNGDMLYAPTGETKPMRVQGTWVSDEEREAVVEFIKKSSEAQYSDEVINEIEKAATEKPGGKGDTQHDDSAAPDHDELLPQAVEVILETGQASVSMLQRRLKLGYSRAARIVDQMEQMGIVGPFEGSKPRQLMITKEQWREMQYSSGTAPVDTFVPDDITADTVTGDDDGSDELL